MNALEQMNAEEMLAHASEAEAYLKLIANKTRLMVLCGLLQQELNVTQLLAMVPVSQSVMSQHLAVLRDANLVATRREGQTIFYRLADDRVTQTMALLYRFFCSPS